MESEGHRSRSAQRGFAGLQVPKLCGADFELGNLVLGMFGVHMGFLTSSGPLGIGISLLVVGVAALNLVLDFDVVEQGARAGAPKYMEWYGAFGLLVTLVWLYLEILRLLSKLNDRR